MTRRERAAARRKLIRFSLARLAGHTEVRTFSLCRHRVMLLNVPSDKELRQYLSRAGWKQVDRRDGEGWSWSDVQKLCPACLQKDSVGQIPLFRDWSQLWEDCSVSLDP